VVDMDKDLQLKSDDPSFSSLLMHGSGRRLKGTRFLNFFERDAPPGGFEWSVSSGELKPGSFVEWLRDAMGQRIKVVLYHMPYISISGTVHHLVGVREDSDGNTQVLLPATELANGFARRSTGRRDSETESVDGESVSSQSSVGSSVPGGNSIVVDIRVDERLTITGATQRFWQTFDCVESEQNFFSDILQVGDAQTLLQWLMDRAGHQQPQIQKFGRVRIRGGSSTGPAWGTWVAQVCFPQQSHSDFEVSIRLVRSRQRSHTQGTPAAIESTMLGAGSQMLQL